MCMYTSLATYIECMHVTRCMMPGTDQKMVIQVMMGMQLEQSKDHCSPCVSVERRWTTAALSVFQAH